MRRTALRRLAVVAATLAIGGVVALPTPASADSDCKQNFRPDKTYKKPFCAPPPPPEPI
jgi:hypothetical protein